MGPPKYRAAHHLEGCASDDLERDGVPELGLLIHPQHSLDAVMELLRRASGTQVSEQGGLAETLLASCAFRCVQGEHRRPQWLSVPVDSLVGWHLRHW